MDDSSSDRKPSADNPGWQQLYEEALTQHNALAYEKARRAIVDQLLALPRGGDPQAVEELVDALRQLFIYEKK